MNDNVFHDIFIYKQVAQKLIRNAISPLKTRKRSLHTEFSTLSGPTSPPKRARVRGVPWSEDDKKALLQFILTRKMTDWPQMRPEHPFWQEASNYMLKTRPYRNGKYCFECLVM